MLTGGFVTGYLDPRLLVPAEWNQIRLLVNDAYLMAGLMLIACASFLVAHAIVPSLLATHDGPAVLAKTRPVFYAIFALALAMSLYAMARMFHLSIIVLRDFYPRFGY